MQMCKLMTRYHRRLTTGPGCGKQPLTSTRGHVVHKQKVCMEKTDWLHSPSNDCEAHDNIWSFQTKHRRICPQTIWTYHCLLLLTSCILVASQVEIMWPHSTGLNSLLSPEACDTGRSVSAPETMISVPIKGPFHCGYIRNYMLFIKSGPTAANVILSKQSLMSWPRRRRWRLQAHVQTTTLKYAAQSAGSNYAFCQNVDCSNMSSDYHRMKAYGMTLRSEVIAPVAIWLQKRHN